MNPSTAQVATAGGTGFAVAELIVGALQDIWHIPVTGAREAALAVVCTALINHFFPQGTASAASKDSP